MIWWCVGFWNSSLWNWYSKYDSKRRLPLATTKDCSDTLYAWFLVKQTTFIRYVALRYWVPICQLSTILWIHSHAVYSVSNTLAFAWVDQKPGHEFLTVYVLMPMHFSICQWKRNLRALWQSFCSSWWNISRKENITCIFAFIHSWLPQSPGQYVMKCAAYFWI